MFFIFYLKIDSWYQYSTNDYAIELVLVFFQQWGSDSNGSNTQGDFLEQLEKFISNLLAARKNMEGQVSLEENGIGAIVDDMTGPADYQVAGGFTYYFYFNDD